MKSSEENKLANISGDPFSVECADDQMQKCLEAANKDGLDFELY